MQNQHLLQIFSVVARLPSARWRSRERRRQTQKCQSVDWPIKKDVT